MTIDKTALRAAILRQLHADLALQTRAAELARDEATNEESRAENKYDTRGQEAAYLAEGQARLAAEIETSIAAYATLPFPVFGAGDRLALGAVARVSDGQRDHWYCLGPRAGGLELNLGEKNLLVVTPQSPLGAQLLGKRAGDSVRAPSRSGGSLQIVEIA